MNAGKSKQKMKISTKIPEEKLRGFYRSMSFHNAGRQDFSIDCLDDIFVGLAIIFHVDTVNGAIFTFAAVGVDTVSILGFDPHVLESYLFRVCSIQKTLTAAGKYTKHHYQYQNHCKYFFHGKYLLFFIIAQKIGGSKPRR